MKSITNREEIRNDYPDYLRDESRVMADAADALVFPENEGDVIHALENANRHDWPVTVSAARTGIVAGAVPLCGGMILSMSKMSMPREIGYDDGKQEWYLTVEPGMLLVGIQECLENYFCFYRNILPESSISLLEHLKGEGRRLFYPPDPTETSATIGGTAATNASGARTFKYGSTREYIRRMRVALTDGTVIDIRRGTTYAGSDQLIHIPAGGNGNPGRDGYTIPVPTYRMPDTKHCAGYFARPGMDGIDLLIGSEGTLGVITEIEIKLCEIKGERVSILAFFDSELDALGYVAEMREGSRNKVLDVEALEYFDMNSLELLRERKRQGESSLPEIPEAGAAIYTEITCTEGELETAFEILEQYLACANSSVERAWAGLEASEIKKMKLFRHSVPETINQIIAKRQQTLPGLHKIATDLAVPDGALQEIMGYYHEALNMTGMQHAIFGHIGNNHLHVNMMPNSVQELNQAERLYADFAQKAVELGGTVAAEHGIGKLKKTFLEYLYGRAGIEEMAQVKHGFDKTMRLGAGTVFDTSVTK